MVKFKDALPYLMIVTLVLFMIFSSNQQLKINKRIATEEQKGIDFERRIQENKAGIVFNRKEKDSLQKVVEGLKLEISEEKKKLITVRKNKNEKINSIVNYDDIQLQEFFARNYPK